MPNENAIVGLVTRIEPSLENRSAEEVLRERPDGVEVSFGEEPAVRLVPGEIAVGTLEILEQLRRMRLPAYVEVEPETRVILRLLIPVVSRVEQTRQDSDVTRVRLEASHAIHILAPSEPDFDELRALLVEAEKSRSSLVITETDDHRIIDVRSWPDQRVANEPSPAPGRPPGLLMRYWRCIRHWCCFWCCRFWCCVSPARADALFNQMSSQTCNPLTVPAPCIPFLYPDDGCWARAHEMCRLMQLQGARPRKIWIDGNLQTPTKNNPNCVVYWGWHVAPTLCVRRWWPFSMRDMVIDPSLFTTPVTLATWKGAQGDPNATLTPSAASLYWRNVMPSDPGYVDTNIRLAYYRLQLKNRSLLPAGPPPYGFCP